MSVETKLEQELHDEKKRKRLLQIKKKEVSLGEMMAASKLLVRSKSKMAILKFLLENAVSSVGEIADGINEMFLEMLPEEKAIQVRLNNYPRDEHSHLVKVGEVFDSGKVKRKITVETVSRLCKKMSEAGILNAYTTSLSKKFRFYEINQKFPIRDVFYRYYRHFSMKAYRLISYDGLLQSDLLKDTLFLDMCADFLLTPHEGFEALEQNKVKIQTAVYNGEKILSRKCQ